MLNFGNPFQNILSLAVLIGFGYLIYAKWKGKDTIFKGLMSKSKEVVDKTNLKGGGLFGK